MQKEITNTVLLGLNMSLLAIILMFVMVASSLRNDLADIRNAEVIANESLQEKLKYSAYEANSSQANLTGMQLIRLITETQSDDLDIYIKNNDVACNNVIDYDLSYNGNYNCYMPARYRLQYADVYNMTISDDNLGEITDSPLVELFANNTEKASKLHYRSYLVYNGDDVLTTAERDRKSTDIVTGIVIKYIP